MKTSLIWNVSENRPFPLELWKHPKIKIQVNQINIADIDKIKLSSNEFNFLFLQVSGAEWEKLKPTLKKEFDIRYAIMRGEDVAKVLGKHGVF